MRSSFVAPPLLIRQTIRCAAPEDPLTRLREMQREVQMRRSDLQSRGLKGETDQLDSRLASILGPAESTQMENPHDKVSKRTKPRKPHVVPARSISRDSSLGTGFIYPERQRTIQRVDGSLPYNRKVSRTMTLGKYELRSLVHFSKDNFERYGGLLPRERSSLAMHQLPRPRNGVDRENDQCAAHILDGLSDAQRNAVLVDPSMACLVLAGPGSGKTRVLTHRYAYLVRKHKVAPHRILAVTFTNKAASEMSERVVRLLRLDDSEKDSHGIGQELSLGTFHSVSARVLRKYGERIGIPRDFDICDSTDSRSILTRVFKESERVETVGSETISQAMAAISNVKNITPEGISRLNSFHYKRVCGLRKVYDEALRRANLLDFDDLLIEVRRLLEECPDVLDELQNRYDNVLVDEWQDTSQVQFDIVSLLAKRRRNLFVVGDVDQSIYKFRGADSRNLQAFWENYPKAALVILEENYRSSRCIVEAAQHVINEDKKRPSKCMTTTNKFGNKIVVQRTQDCRNEANFVISQLKQLKHSGKLEHFSDAAVMYRTNVQSRQIEEAFILANVPYRLLSGIRFYERAEIKDIVAYIKLIANPRDDNSFRRIVNIPPRGIGKRTIYAIEEFAGKENIPFVDAVTEMIKPLPKKEDEFSLRPRTIRSLTCFYNLLHNLRQRVSSLAPGRAATTLVSTQHSKDQPLHVGELIATVVEETGYGEYLVTKERAEQGSMEKGLQRRANVDELIRSASRYDSILEFLERVALWSNTDGSGQDPQSTPVCLMTLHSGKGLEFKAVFVVGAEDDLIPTIKNTGNNQEAIDEERRLLYVGMTRAKSFLYITWRASKLIITKNGITRKAATSSPSRFLRAIPKRYLLHSTARR